MQVKEMYFYKIFNIQISNEKISVFLLCILYKNSGSLICDFQQKLLGIFEIALKKEKNYK